MLQQKFHLRLYILGSNFPSPRCILLQTIIARGDTLRDRLNDKTVESKLPDVALGDFIQSKVILGEPKRKYHSTDSGTIADKPRFAKEVCEQITNFNELSPEAKKLTKSIFNFIVEANK